MTKKPSRLEKAAEKHEAKYGSELWSTRDDFCLGAIWAYRALLREMKKDHMDCSIAELRYLWRRISKGEK